jgi:hypothetical protein
MTKMALRLALVAGLGMTLSTAAANAQIVSNAADVGTIKNAGPRTGTSGKTFFNVEGDSAGTANVSYGIAQFSSFSGLTPPVTVNAIQVNLSEANAAFTAPGVANFYFSEKTPFPDFQPGTSTLTYSLGATPSGVGSTLDPLHFLGTGALTTTGNVNNGKVDSFTFSFASLDAGSQAYITSELNAGGPFFLVITPADNLNPGNATLAATWAGVGNTTPGANAPQLVFNPVPEPTSLALVGAAVFGFGGLAWRRRRAVRTKAAV